MMIIRNWRRNIVLLFFGMGFRHIIVRCERNNVAVDGADISKAA